MTHISTLRLHQLRLGELPAAEQSILHAHLDACPVCAGRLAHQDSARTAFVRAPVPAALAPRRSMREWLWALRAAFVFLPIAAAGLFVVGSEPAAEAEPSTDQAAATTEHAKGQAPLLEAWVQTGDSARPVYTNERVRAGTRVQLKYDAGRHRFVTLAGRDGKGTVEVYGTVPATGPGVRNAPFALQLDATKGDQSFFAILTDTRPEPEQVMTALAHDPIRMDQGEIASVVVQKE